MHPYSIQIRILKNISDDHKYAGTFVKDFDTFVTDFCTFVKILIFAEMV